MLLLSSPRSGPLRRASLLLLAAVLLCVVSVSSGLPAAHKCPHHIDCAKEGRHFCKPGSSRCGPCLSPLQENEEGSCVERRRHHQPVTFNPDLDREIDFLESVLEKQEVTEIKTPKKQIQHPAAVTSQSDVQKNETDASKQEQKNQALIERAHAVTAAPGPLSDPPAPQPRVSGAEGRAVPSLVPAPRNDMILVILISLSVIVGLVAVILATVCYIKTEKEARLVEKVDYPAFSGPSAPPAPDTGSSMGDKTLAQNAQMYHYQHQKQQMLSMGTHKPEQKVIDNEVTSDEEEVGGDFTVYECPGLAPTGEMEVKNPLFDDSTLHYQGNDK
ncbi:neural proliferation differentiation and control protein 1a isoform X2 [Hippoglossus stenolepis]|uniref:neural proliferation differentiation and control protein 1a isoform X2 n=1 Tax=Hippoglossus stenolepis TaxID=195615 RepID=UPI00159CAB2A|nr:neural proliferation differentiation and control protein 1a isoform X2 [Hippoglossus stenolepis]